MTLELLKIAHVLRRMRGGSQSFLVQAEDHFFYVAKFCGNPQGNRTLINEWMGHRILAYLNISVPPVCTLYLDTPGNQQLCFQVGRRSFPVPDGIHWGSRVPVDPATTAVFDFLPRSLFPKISNLADFARVFVIDKWLGNTDIRQAIFVRDTRNAERLAFRAYFIDNGMLFAGSQWDLFDSDRCGLYVDTSVYAGIDMETVCMQTTCQISKITADQLREAFRTAPGSWFEGGDKKAIDRLLAELIKRQNKLPGLISEHLKHLPSRQPRSSEAVAVSNTLRSANVYR